MIATRPLAELCRRAGTSLHAGLDVRQVFRREATIGSATQQRHMADVARQIDRGENLAEALAAQNYLPPLALEMIDIGEQTGKLERVFLQLADHYENILTLRRVFLVGIIWPALQLFMAIAIVGLLILVMGWIGEMTGGKPVDILGLGLVGTWGLVKYLSFVGVVVGGIGTLIYMLSQGKLWTGSLMHLLIRVPVVGSCLQYFAMSRLAWALAMSHEAGMSVDSSLRLALRASQNIYYSSTWPQVEQELMHRGEITEALRKTQRFPDQFLTLLETGELSGTISEIMIRYAAEMRDRAQSQLKALTVVVGMALGMLVMLLLAGLIIRIVWIGYLSPIYNALDELK